MKPEQWQKVGEIFHAALQCQSGERKAFIEEACSGDEELRRELESLLSEESGARQFIEDPAMEVMARDVAVDQRDSLIGKRIGPYKIISLLGVGGMGEVYRAEDVDLKRPVAVKVLARRFATDRERMARFEREAHLLASLNHLNIAVIYGLQESNGVRALVMELVEGRTLADRISAGPIPVEEALPIALQMAEALEYSHEKGVIHRDLKPANVKLTPEGTVKVLDFGLGKVLEETTTNQERSPTVTESGLVLGTVAYMSPEQARGKPVDRGTDIWSFGCVLYELLAGQRAFAGETATDAMAAILGCEPDWHALPRATPPGIRRLLRRCLEKDPRRRLHHIADARIDIEDTLAGSPASTSTEPTRTRREGLTWSMAAILAVVAVVALAIGTVAYFQRAEDETRAIRFLVFSPDLWSMDLPHRPGDLRAAPPLAISPDGRRIAFVARNSGKSLLWVRPLASVSAQPLAGTDGATAPFWSPDGAFIGFFAGGKLKKIEVSGGPPIPLCDAPDNRGATWNRDGVILFARFEGEGLQKVSAAGGQPTAATVLSQDEVSHALPFFLPDGRHFLYGANLIRESASVAIYVASLDSPERKLLLNTDPTNVLHTQGHLLFLRQATLMAQPFDARRLELAGSAFSIGEQIWTDSPGWEGVQGAFSASESGVLAYQGEPATGGGQLKWVDRNGNHIGVLGDPAVYAYPELSPNGKRASVSILDRVTRTRDIWIYDLARNFPTRFTFDPSNEFVSRWSPDGRRIVFNSDRKGHLDLYEKETSGVSSEEVLFEDGLDNRPVSWSPDGRFILFAKVGPTTGLDLWVLPLSGDREPFVFLKTPFSESHGQFSPDGRWVAYRSNESGRDEVYVTPFPGPGGKVRVSINGMGTNRVIRWRSDGAEIFYLAPDDTLMAAAVNERGPNFEVGDRRPLFQMRVGATRYSYCVSPDGRRFLIVSPPESTPITVVVNWKAGLREK